MMDSNHETCLVRYITFTTIDDAVIHGVDCCYLLKQQKRERLCQLFTF